jgi:hypothetical protein
MHQEIFERLAIQQVVCEAWAIFEAKYLMDGGVTEIGVDEENRLSRLHRKTHRQVHRSQRLAFTVARTGDAQHIPVMFSKALHDLGPQNLKGIDKRTLVVRSHHSPMTKHREWNIQRPRPGIYDGARQGLAAGSLSGLWPGTKLTLLVFMKLQRSPKSVHGFS